MENLVEGRIERMVVRCLKTPYLWDEKGRCIMSPKKKGTLYTSSYNRLDSKAYFDYSGLVFSISRQLPDDKRITKEMQWIELAPSEQLFRDYKSCKISWLQFEQRFLNEINKEAIKDLCSLLNEGDNVLLLCFEKKNKFCHRRLIAEFIKELGYEVKEL